MRLAFTFVLIVHALIHLMGVAKAFGWAVLPQLTMPISRALGLVWLAAALLLLAAAALWWAAPRLFWIVGGIGLVASQVAIVASWADARYGSLANLVLLGVVVHAAASWGPFGLRSDFKHLVAQGQAGLAEQAGAVVTDNDLASLPAPVQRYLRRAGVVGQPRPQAFQVRMSGRIRGTSDGAWMPFSAEQHSVTQPPRRYFFMRATRSGVPVDVLHVYAAEGASMRVRLLSLFPMVSLDGDALTRAETVTLLNDMAIMAPAALLDPAIRWRTLDARQVEARYRVGPHEVSAVLVFGDDGALVDFWSDDRPALAADGQSLQPWRWSTPVGGYRQQGAYWLASRGEARYAAPAGDYAYLELASIAVTLAGTTPTETISP